MNARQLILFQWRIKNRPHIEHNNNKNGTYDENRVIDFTLDYWEKRHCLRICVISLIDIGFWKANSQNHSIRGDPKMCRLFSARIWIQQQWQEQPNMKSEPYVLPLIKQYYCWTCFFPLYYWFCWCSCLFSDYRTLNKSNHFFILIYLHMIYSFFPAFYRIDFII